MIYKGIIVSKEHYTDPCYLGYRYAISQKDNWVDLPNDFMDNISTYNVGTTYVTIDNITYTIHKDFMIANDNIRLFILKNRNLTTDIVDEGIKPPEKYKVLQKITAIKGAYVDIDMPVTEDMNIRIIYSFELNEVDSLYPLFGVSEGYAKNELLYRVRNNYIEINSGDSRYNYTQVASNNSMYTADISSTGLILNGTKISSDNLVPFNGSSNIHLFQANVINPEERYVYIHAFSVTSSSKNIQLIPCELLTDVSNGSVGEIGFWDIVNDEFVPNTNLKGLLIEELPYYRLSNIFAVGGAYIDTKLDSLVNREYRARIYGLLPQDYILFGSNTGATRSGWMVSPSSSEIDKMYASYGPYTGTDKKLPAENTFDIVDLSIIVSNNNKTISVNIDGIDIGTDTISGTIGNELNTYLFGFNNNGTVGLNNAVVPIAYYKELRDDSSTSLELYPIKLKDSGLITMLDNVSDNIYTHSGTGTLLYLETLDSYEYLEYLEVNGLQYIQTGIVPRPITTYEMDIVDYNPNQRNTVLFGSQSTDDVNRLYSGIIYNDTLYVGNSTSVPLVHKIERDTKHIKLEVNDILKTATLTIDGYVNVYNYTGTSLVNVPITIFSNNRLNDGIYQNSACKCSRFRIYTPDEYLLDLYPVYYSTTNTYAYVDGVTSKIIVSDLEPFVPPIDPDIRTVIYCTAINNYVLLDEYTDSLDDIYEFNITRTSISSEVPFGTSTGNGVWIESDVADDVLPAVIVGEYNDVYIGNDNIVKTSLGDINGMDVRVVLVSSTMTCEIYLDGVLKYSGSFSAVPSNLRLALFTLNINNYYGIDEVYMFSGEIRYFRRIDGLTNDVIGNYIAAQRISTNTAGYYNTVTKTLHTGERGTILTNFDNYELHYGLRSTGSQYVATDYLINENDTAALSRVHIKFSIDTLVGGYYGYRIHGSGGSAIDSCYYIGSTQDGQLVYGNFDNNIVVPEFNWIPYKIYDCVIDYKNRELIIDDKKIADIDLKPYGIYNPAFVLYGYNKGTGDGISGGVGNTAPSSLYLCDIYIDDVLTHSFKPATDLSNGINGVLNNITGVFSPCNSILNQLLPIEKPEVIEAADYEELDYIESDGTQSILLEYAYADVSRIEDRVALTEVNELYNFCGGVVANIYWGSYQYYWTSGNVTSDIPSDTNIHDWEIDVVANKVSVDGIALPQRTSIANNTYKIALFTINSYGDDIKKQKRYRTKLYDLNGDLLCDLIPAILLKDFDGHAAGSIGLLDLSHSKFYQSSTTSLIAGSVKSSKFIQLDYIESDGNHIIDTGLYGTESTEFGVEIALTDLKQQRIAGSRTAYNISNITFSYPTNGSTNYANADFQSSDTNRLATNYPFIMNQFYTMITSPTMIQIGNEQKPVSNVTAFTTSTTLKLFDGDGLTYTNQKMIGKLKRSWVKNGTKLDGYFIPVILTESVSGYNKGEIGIYDIVTNTFRKSTTGAEFKYGTMLHTTEYTPLRYVEATGEQYCDTGFLPNNESGMKVIFEIDPSDVLNNRVIAGINNPVSGGSRFYLGNNGGERIYGWASVNNIGFDSTKPGITINKLNYLNSRRAEFNESIFVDSMHLENPQFTNTLYGVTLFTYALPAVVSNIPLFYISGKMYEAEFTQANRVVRRYMPARIDSIGWVGFVDVLNQNKFIHSMTDTPLVAGPEIPDDQIHEDVLYAYGYGGAYINTKIPLQSDLMYDIVGAFGDTSGIEYPIGGLGGGVRSAPLAIDSSQYGQFFGHVDDVPFVPERYGSVVSLDKNFHHWIYNEPNTHAIKIDGTVVDTYVNTNHPVSIDHYIYVYARNYAGASTVNDFKLVNLVIRDKNAEMMGSYKPVRNLRTGEVYLLNEYNNEIFRNASPFGSITFRYKVDEPTTDGLILWLDAKDQSGTEWKSKVGSHVMTVADSWKDNCYSKVPGSLETLDTLNLAIANGFTADLNYTIMAYPDTIINRDTQIYSLYSEVNNNNGECILHYLYYTGNNTTAYYGPQGSIFNGLPRRDSLHQIGLREFISDVAVFDGGTSFKSYINLSMSHNEVVVDISNVARYFAFRRLSVSGLNNMTALIRSFRLYDRPLTDYELSVNRLYDIGLFNYYPTGDLPTGIDVTDETELPVEDIE